jgi:hypothetical protein
MKRIAYSLITVSFLAAAYFSVIDPELVPWPKVIPALLVGLAGVAMIQISARSKERAVDTVRTNIEKLEESLSNIVANAIRLDETKDSIDPYEIRHRIDELFMDDLDTFVENRESISHAFGLQAYANVMTSFATGERYLNRCWSASTDGYIDEVHTYLTRAKIQFEEALELLRTHTGTASEGCGTRCVAPADP